MDRKEIIEGSGLMKKTKKELIEIIYRKDDKENEIKKRLNKAVEKLYNSDNSIDNLVSEVSKNKAVIRKLRNYAVFFGFIALIELIIILVQI